MHIISRYTDIFSWCTFRSTSRVIEALYSLFFRTHVRKWTPATKQHYCHQECLSPVPPSSWSSLPPILTSPLPSFLSSPWLPSPILPHLLIYLPFACKTEFWSDIHGKFSSWHARGFILVQFQNKKIHTVQNERTQTKTEQFWAHWQR